MPLHIYIKKTTAVALLLFIFSYGRAQQNVGIGTTTPNPKAALEISASNKGLLMPRLGLAQRTAIANPPKGLMVYDTTFSAFYYYDGGRWLPFYQQNYDSTTIDYSSAAATVTNASTSTSTKYISSNANSGFIYDNGGAAGNYLPNSNSAVVIYKDDSTVAIKINLEEMAAETFYDSLFIIHSSSSDINDWDTIGISGTQTGNYIFNDAFVQILFKSNGVNQLGGFKIRWARVKVNTAIQQTAPLYGWHFNMQKQAAMGGLPQANNWHTDSVGLYSIGYGNGVKAKGNYSFASGRSSNAIGNFSTAMGDHTLASGNYATAAGESTTATGSHSFAMGSGTNANGIISVAMGSNTNANGIASTALGANTRADGLISIAMGSGTQAIGEVSTAMGALTKANGFYSTATGNSTVASGYSTTSMGYYTYAKSFASLSIGRYNDSISTSTTNSWVNTDPIFIIGNGTAENARRNALVVLKNGNVSIGNNNNPVTPLHITEGNSLNLTSGTGFLTLGFIGSSNLVIDQNEIQARLNGAASDFYLQRYGGNLMIGGVIAEEKLTVYGNAAKSTGGSSWVTFSDARLKENIVPYSDGLASLMKINPVRYNYKANSGCNAAEQYVGILAQDLQKISPYMVSTSTQKIASDGSGYLKVDNSAMTYMLINAVKEQQKLIEELKTRLEHLERK